MDYIIGKPKPKPAPAPVPLAVGASAGGEASSDFIVDGTEATFMHDVIEASRSVPVIVDFWATWCGPCKVLTPALERVVRSAGGQVKLVKVDIDLNRALVAQLTQLGLPMQSVPTVAAFWKGQIADLFQGALPESEVKRFVEGLLKLTGGTMPTADLLIEARVALDDGQAREAAAIFAEVLQAEPESPEGWGGMIRAVLATGDEDQAQDMLCQIPPSIAEHAEISGARAAVALAAEGRAAQGQLTAIQARIDADPADYAARYELAAALNAAGQRTEAAEALLDIVRRDRAWNEGAARLQLLKLFEAWGLADATTVVARRKLSALLFA